MAKHKKIKISTSPDSVDRRARQLLHHHLQGEMDAYELSEEYEKIRAAGSYGPEFISLYMTHAIQTNQVDHRILSFMDAGNRRYPDHVKIRMGLLLTADFLGFSAMTLDLHGRLGVAPAAAAGYEDIARRARQALDSSGVSWKNDREVCLTLDRARWDGMFGRYDEAAGKVNSVLADRPLWAPALAAKAVLDWDACRFDQAELALKSLLGLEPHHPVGIHGMARLLILGNRREEEEAYARLLSDEVCFGFDPVQDLEFYLAADQGKTPDPAMETQISQALETGMSPAYFVHLAAVFFCHQGDERKAKGLWNKVLDDPGVGFLAEQNLLDLQLPRVDREGPFVFRLMELLPLSCRFEEPETGGPAPLLMELTLERMLAALRCKATPLHKGIGAVLLRHGEANALKHFFLRMAGPWTPELDSFFLDQVGAEDIPALRRRNLAHLLASTGIGKEDFCVPDEPDLEGIGIHWDAMEDSPRFQQLYEKAFRAHKEKHYQEAVDGYAALLKTDDDKPAVWQNLCHALIQLGNTTEVERLTARMKDRFPYYLHVQVEAARQLHAQGRHGQAWRIVHGLLSRDNYHGDDLRILMQLCVDLFMTEKRYSVAARYLKAWRGFEIEEERLYPYVVLDTLNAIEGLRSKFEQREKRRAAKAAREAPTLRSDSEGRTGKKDKENSKDKEDPRQLSLF